MNPLLALSVRHPWALALALGIKDIENRDGPTLAARARKLVGHRIALHASKAVPRDTVETVELLVLDEIWQDDTFPHVRDVLAECKRTAGCIVAVGTLARVIEHGDGDPLHASDWRTQARYGLVFTDMVRLAEPVPAVGMLGFWRVPDEAAARVAAQTARAA